MIFEAKPFYLENESIRVVVLPQNGGKVASIRSVRTGMEFLLAGSRYEHVAAYESVAPFEESDCAGWDECLPSVSACNAGEAGEAVPDHGDFWRMPWTVVGATEGRAIALEACGFSRPLLFRKEISLHTSELHIEYSIKNMSETAVPILYASHPLFCVDPEDSVLLPSEITNLRLLWMRSERFGSLGDTVSWPYVHRDGVTTDLRCVGRAEDETAEMFYMGRLQRGICGLYRARSKQGLLLHFNPETLPYLGLWLCNGGWPEDHSRAKQYAVALEPTTSPCGSLHEAIEGSTAHTLTGGETFSFLLRLEMVGSEGNLSLENFQDKLDAQEQIASGL